LAVNRKKHVSEFHRLSMRILCNRLRSVNVKHGQTPWPICETTLSTIKICYVAVILLFDWNVAVEWGCVAGPGIDGQFDARAMRCIGGCVELW